MRSFQRNNLQEFIDYVKYHQLLEMDEDEVQIHATGGGAYKYAELFDKAFNGKVKLRKHDEMQSLVDGMSFVLNYAKQPAYTFRENEGKIMVDRTISKFDKSDERLDEKNFDACNTSLNSSLFGQ